MPIVQGSLRSTRVRAFLVAEAISAIGTFATFIAIWGYAAFEFGATATDVSLFGIALTLPGVLLGPVVGTIIDRIGPKATLVVAKLVGVVASLALLAADDFRTLAALSLVHGVAGALTVPALQSLPPRIVPTTSWRARTPSCRWPTSWPSWPARCSAPSPSAPSASAAPS